MRPFLIAFTAALLTGCGLTPKQLEKMDGVMCNTGKGYGIEMTTVVVGGASKPDGVVVTPQCGVAIQNARPEAAVAKPMREVRQ